MSGEKILVIDDRRENLLFLANSVLRPEGYEVITAMDGKQGLDKALAERPDLIITDLKMPHMSGLEMMSALRKAEVPIPVILTTFYGSEQAAIQAFRLGAKDYIVKPYEIAEMLDSVDRALVEQRLRRQALGMKEGLELSQQLEERVRQLHSLCGIGKALMSIQDGDEAGRVAVEAAIYVTSANAGQLFLLNEGTRQLELRVVRGPSESRARNLQQPGADRIATEVARTGKTLVAERDTGERNRVLCLAVPLRAGAKTVGVLGVDAKRNELFNENDRYHLGILADFAAVALLNARHIERLKSEAAPAAGEDESAGADQVARALTPGLDEALAGMESLSRELGALAMTARSLVEGLRAQNRDS
jgi:two-component system NtrC family sensor kinase